MNAMHNPPGQHEVLLTNGSNHTFEVTRMLLLCLVLIPAVGPAGIC